MFTQQSELALALDALGPTIRSSVIDTQADVGSPIEAIIVTHLAALSLASQALCDVETRPNLISPVSLYLLAILDSGERKTATFNCVMRPIVDFMAVVKDNEPQLRIKQKGEKAAWNEELQGISRSIRRKAELGEDTTAESERLAEHFNREPEEPKRFNMLYERYSPAALAQGLSKSHPTLGVFCDEAIFTLQGGGLSDLGLLNKAWDGSSIRISTVSGGEISIHDPRITMLLMLQSHPFKKLIDKKGESLTSSGFLARTFGVKPYPLAGFRFTQAQSNHDLTGLAQFHRRIDEILQMNKALFEKKTPSRIKLALSEVATRSWSDINNSIETSMQPGGFFFPHKDFASKLSNKITRIAALLHFFEGHEGEISISTFERAITICRWLSTSYVSVLTPPPEPPQECQDAALLHSWIFNRIQATRNNFIKKNDVRQFGPGRMRSWERLNAALNVLIANGILVLQTAPQSKTMMISLTQVGLSNLYTAPNASFLLPGAI